MLVLRDTAKAEASASGEDKKALRRQNRVSSALATIEEPDEGRKKKRAVPLTEKIGLKKGRKEVTYPDGETRYDGDWVEFKRQGDGVLTGPGGEYYDGQWRDDNRHGKGTGCSKKGEEYDGDWSCDKYHGVGLQTYVNGDTYEGQWKLGKRYGTGVLTVAGPAGYRYEGQWEFGMANGEGIWCGNSGQTYSGSWKHNVRSGIATITWKNGDEYKGEVEDGLLKGRGTWTGNNGITYSGQFLEDERHGFGVCSWPNGDRYEGNWQKDVRSDRGKMLYGLAFTGTETEGGEGGKGKEEGTVYDGEWVGDKPKGSCVLTYPDGQVYNGGWDGQEEGTGTLTKPTGYVYKGQWTKGNRTGVATVSFADGRIYLGGVCDGACVGGEGDKAGFLLYPDSTFYTGVFKGEGVVTGKGRLVRSQGDWYEGDLLAGLRSGEGTCIWPDGGVYEGCWKGGERHGEGRYRRPAAASGGGGGGGGGDVSYQGQWDGDHMHGKGSFSDATVPMCTDADAVGRITDDLDYLGGVSSFIGTFNRGVMDGTAEALLWTTGATYKGMLHNGDLHGAGSLTFGPASYAGEFNCNVRDGHGVFVDDREGIRYQGEWSGGRYAGVGSLTCRLEHSPTEGDSSGNSAPAYSLYAGQWEDSKRVGYGSSEDGKGSSYQGLWLDDNMSGSGTYSTTGGGDGAGDNAAIVYNGDFVTGMFSGTGRVDATLKSGEMIVYHGTFTSLAGHPPLADSEQETGERGGGVQPHYVFGKGGIGGPDGIALLGKGRVQFCKSRLEYSGSFVRGRRHGFGSLSPGTIQSADSSSESYTGAWVNDARTGFGKYSSGGDAEETYQGEWLNNLYHGKGSQLDAKGNQYDGSFDQGKRNGKGVLRMTDGSLFDGEFENAVRNGRGTMTFPSKDEYKGEWEEDHRSGTGAMLWANGDGYKGEWDADLRHGNGKMTVVETGDVYEGDWELDLPDGIGEYTWGVSKDCYSGQWSKGERHGKGKVQSSDGSGYEGQWSRGCRHGLGRETIVNNTGDDQPQLGETTAAEGPCYYEGAYVDDVRAGVGKYIYPDGTTYEGDWKEGKAHGKGRYTSPGASFEGEWEGNVKVRGTSKYTNGLIYVGELTPSGSFTGEGTLLFSNGDRYEGQWQDSVKNGAGTFTWVCKDVYKGQYVDGEQSGNGEFVSTDGSLYDGSWMCNRRNGAGRWVGPEGDTYNGEWKDDVMHGVGTCKAADGTVYTGQWVDGIQSGNGEMSCVCEYGVDVYNGCWVAGLRAGIGEVCYSTGDTYKGEWQDDLPNGAGTFAWLASNKSRNVGDVFSGQWLNGKQHGEGSLSYSVSGDKYTGGWSGNQRAGKGELTYQSGDVYQGEWGSDCRHGEGVMTWQNGDQYHGLWRADCQEGPGILERKEVGSTYDGEWKRNDRHGRGIKKESDGSYYDGTWQWGKRHGQGVLYDAQSKETFNGGFNGGAKHGKGMYCYPDGTKVKGTWDEGNRVGESTWQDTTGNQVVEVASGESGTRSRTAQDRSGAVKHDMHRCLRWAQTPYPLAIYRLADGGQLSKDKAYLTASAEDKEIKWSDTAGGAAKGSILFKDIQGITYGPQSTVFASRARKSEDDWLCFTICYSDGGSTLDCVVDGGGAEDCISWVLAIQAAILMQTPSASLRSRGSLLWHRARMRQSAVAQQHGMASAAALAATLNGAAVTAATDDVAGSMTSRIAAAKSRQMTYLNPLNESELAEQRAAAQVQRVKRMCDGYEMELHDAHKKGPSTTRNGGTPVYLALSADQSKLTWGSKKSSMSNNIKVEDIESISFGMNAATMASAFNSKVANPPADWLVMMIAHKASTLSVSVPNPADENAVMDLCAGLHCVAGQRLRGGASLGKYLWMRTKAKLDHKAKSDGVTRATVVISLLRA